MPECQKTIYAVLDMNDDGIPELAVTTVIFQERNSETLELGSTFFDSAIFLIKMEKYLYGAAGISAITLLRF